MVDNRFEAALEEARNADCLIQSKVKDLATLERETPFLGVPFTAKDCFAVKGNAPMSFPRRSKLDLTCNIQDSTTPVD